MLLRVLYTRFLSSVRVLSFYKTSFNISNDQDTILDCMHEPWAVKVKSSSNWSHLIDVYLQSSNIQKPSPIYQDLYEGVCYVCKSYLGYLDTLI